ncbi:hypothetical protein BTO30_03215 [Domibacillus antri]|uniref:Uncharacterized protein n=1 Tax=Domibacillus antri TaxID=1714264 RepID=A0A1Q8Q8C0_9BACI|nr:hypothetical protein [Domibacillus antri]OLN23594.1 hypothetical protein BTO30_03215 [Domibacillus antri]
MDNKIDLIKKQYTDFWEWVGTRKSSITCSEKLIDEMVDESKLKFEENGEEILDIYVYKYEEGLLPFVTIEFLTRPKQKES